MEGLYLSLLFIVLVINLFLSYFKRAPLKIDAIIFHLFMTLVLKHHCLSQSAFFSGCNWKLKLNLCFPRSFMQLKSDAGNLDSHVTPAWLLPLSSCLYLWVWWPFWKCRRILGCLSYHGHGSGVLPLSSLVFLAAQLLLQGWWYFPLWNHSQLSDSHIYVNKVSILILLRLTEVFLFDCSIFCSDCKVLRR